MTTSIRQIYIENFRSIRRLTIPLKQLSIFVGKNDAGKSNILRALNVFFNNETNPGKQLIFSEDFNANYTPPYGKAKEIIVRLEIDIPESYQKTNGDFVIWERRWRANGIAKDVYQGVRNVTGKKGAKRRLDLKIPEKSNLHSLLKKIEYRYVPAIKDSQFFDTLRGNIYGIISEVATDTFRTSSSSFEASIANHLEDLTGNIEDALGFQTRLALPRDLSHIFERLDFLSGEKSISLDNRGDGIKARHIPLILKFMDDKKSSIQGHGSMPPTFIWGYEEPENNLEITNCVALADDFWNYANEENAQILLTTHSPVFYNLQEKNKDDAEIVTCNHVYFDGSNDGTRIEITANDLDEKMGTMALFAPKVQMLEKKIRDAETAKHLANELAQQNRRKIFVEGTSDKYILKRAIEVFAKTKAGQIDIETKNFGAGHSYVIDMLQGWRAVQKHHPDRPKAVGILDGDADAKNALSKWNSDQNNIKSCKCFKYPAPKHLYPALHAGYNVPITLETLYSPHIWSDALDEQKLTKRDLEQVLPKAIKDQLYEGTISLSDIATEEWGNFVLWDFDFEAKIPTARKIARQKDAEFSQAFPELKNLVEEIIRYLFPEAT